MDIQRVDPRVEESTVDDPVYWVIFWERQPAGGYRTDEYELRGATSVREVLDWAERNAGTGRTFVVYVFDERRRETIRLFGSDPQDSGVRGG